jgi:hypothetical protein
MSDRILSVMPSSLPPQPIFSLRLYFLYGMLFQQHFLEKMQRCVRMVCVILLGCSFLLLLCLAPLHWVQLMVLTDRQKLLAGLWSVCHHSLCWSHVPKAPCECFPSPVKELLLRTICSDPPSPGWLCPPPSHSPALS